MTEARSLPTTEQEAELLKQTFKDNEYLLKVIRSLFFGFPTTTEQKALIKKIFANSDLRQAVRKKLYPLLSNDVPIGQVADFWMGTEANVYGASRDTIYQSIASKQRVLEMLDLSTQLLENPDGEQVDLTYNPNLAIDELQVWLLARNLYIKTVETGLHFIKVVADVKEESKEERAKRQVQNSSK